MSTRIRLTCAALLLAALPCAWGQGTPSITVEYRDKPPYSYTEKGRPAGFLLERTQKLFERAHLEAQWVEVPIRRTLLNLQANQAALCTPGLYKLPEREVYSRFSLPIHQDKPHVVLAHPEVAARVRATGKVASLFADASLTLGVLDGVSYGAELDLAINSAPKPPVRAQITPLQLARMVGARRVDYMLIDAEDLGWLRRDAFFAALGLVSMEFADMPRGQRRYIACATKVEPPQMERLNQAIRELLPELQSAD